MFRVKSENILCFRFLNRCCSDREISTHWCRNFFLSSSISFLCFLEIIFSNKQLPTRRCSLLAGVMTLIWKIILDINHSSSVPKLVIILIKINTFSEFPHPRELLLPLPPPLLFLLLEHWGIKSFHPIQIPPFERK